MSIAAPWYPSCYSQLVQASTEVLFTLEEAKLRAGLDWAAGDPRDQLMMDFVAAATQKVELDTGLALTTQIRDVFYTVPVDGIVPLPGQCTPTQALEEIATTRRNLHARFLRLQRTNLSMPERLLMEVGSSGTVRVTAGWPSKEALKAEAPLLYQAVGLLIGHFAVLNRDLAITGAVASVNIIPEGYEAAISPYRLMWVT